MYFRITIIVNIILTIFYVFVRSLHNLFQFVFILKHIWFKIVKLAFLINLDLLSISRSTCDDCTLQSFVKLQKKLSGYEKSLLVVRIFSKNRFN